MYFYHVEIFLAAIDAILTEMNYRFSEVSSELLVCMTTLNPRNSFSSFDVDKLVRLAEIYAEDFDVGLCCYQVNLKNCISVLETTKNFLDAQNFQRLLKLWSTPK